MFRRCEAPHSPISRSSTSILRRLEEVHNGDTGEDNNNDKEQDEDDDEEEEEEDDWFDVSKDLLENGGERESLLSFSHSSKSSKCHHRNHHQKCFQAYKVIFKVGHDIRQDQFALQMINLFDRIFLDCGLDMKITPFRVLATSATSGFVEYVDSQSVSSINSQHGSIMKYFSKMTHEKLSLKSVISNFSKSCAAYCVMTYVLGVGDRHLDNLLVTHDGKLFHVDFAYLFGSDPRQALPLPPIRLTKEMIDAMGGPASEGFGQFRRLCHTAYLVLRRYVADMGVRLFPCPSLTYFHAVREQREHMATRRRVN